MATKEEIKAEIERFAAEAPPVDLDAKSKDNGQTELIPLPAYQPFPIDALPDRVRAYVEAVASATGTDPAFSALAALVVLSGCVGNRIAAMVKSGWVEPAVLWGILIGPSGSLKSPVLKQFIRALVDIFKVARTEYDRDYAEYKAEVARHAVRLADWKKNQRDRESSTDPPDEPEKPKAKRLIVSDVTIEKLGSLLQDNPLGLLLYRDELSAWVGAFDRYSGGKGSDRPAWLSMYDASSIHVDRKSDGSVFVDRAAVSVVGGIQPGTLARVFGNAERESGLLARCLLVFPPHAPALWTDAGLGDALAEDWRQLLHSLLALDSQTDDLGHLRPCYIPIGNVALTDFIAWHDRHAREIVEVGNDDLAAHFAKLKGAAARIALILAIVESVSTGTNLAYIDVEPIRRAIRIVEWFKVEAKRIYPLLGRDADVREQQSLIDWIQRKGGSCSVRELHRSGRFRTAPDAEAALAELVEAGRGVWPENSSEGKVGRPESKRFILNGSTQ